MATALTEFVELLGGAIVSLAEKIAEGVSSMASALFLKTNSSTHAVEGLSIFGGIMGIFCGISLAVGVTTRVFLWVTSLGRN